MKRNDQQNTISYLKESAISHDEAAEGLREPEGHPGQSDDTALDDILMRNMMRPHRGTGISDADL